MGSGLAAGAAFGMATHTTSMALTADLGAARTRDQEISQEVNRVLLQLW